MEAPDARGWALQIAPTISTAAVHGLLRPGTNREGDEDARALGLTRWDGRYWHRTERGRALHAHLVEVAALLNPKQRRALGGLPFGSRIAMPPELGAWGGYGDRYFMKSALGRAVAIVVADA